MLHPVRRPRLGLAISWFVAFWVAGVHPSLAAAFAAWTVYWALSERPAVGPQWAAFGASLTVVFAVATVHAYL